MKNLDKVLFSNCFKNKLFDKKFGIFASQDAIPIGRYNKMGLLPMEYIFKIQKTYMKENGIKFNILSEGKRAQVLQITNGSKSVIISSDRLVKAKKCMPQQMTDRDAFFCYYFYQTINEKILESNIVDIQKMLQEARENLNYQLSLSKE